MDEQCCNCKKNKSEFLIVLGILAGLFLCGDCSLGDDYDYQSFMQLPDIDLLNKV